MLFNREIYETVLDRAQAPRGFIQVLAGPRQVGKTTLARQLKADLTISCIYASADEAGLQESSWVKVQWDLARQELLKNPSKGALLILDEIQKLPHWSKWVKQLWDEDSFNQLQLKVILLGSAPWLIQQGLGDSLAGRFEIISISHWSYTEMHQAFDMSLEQYIYFGAYPGAAQFIKDRLRWSRYIIDSLVETTLSRDILLMTQINKPALLRQLFKLSCGFSAQILSYQKMLGQLDDAGNTTTLAHYLKLLEAAGLVRGLTKYTPNLIRERNSSPKLIVLNTALMSAHLPSDFEQTRAQPELWGRLLESMVGAHLCSQTMGTQIQVYYWREGNKEVDYVLSNGKQLVAIEVKSGRSKNNLPGMTAFIALYKPHRAIQIGDKGLSLEKFLTTPIEDFFKNPAA